MTNSKSKPPSAQRSSAESWRLTLLPADATVEQAIHSLDASAQQIVLAVAEDDVLIGTVTDGDIRRALLRGLTLESSIDTIVYREPLVVPPQIERELALQLMQSNKVHQLPVVDENRRVVGLH
ncbi:MAG: CBS domain-containing protein, partial [Gammaproteobacteria bacterium]|nr:CBS domain-containing protein [Gammaproteobacteria bacterium]